MKILIKLDRMSIHFNGQSSYVGGKSYECGHEDMSMTPIYQCSHNEKQLLLLSCTSYHVTRKPPGNALFIISCPHNVALESASTLLQKLLITLIPW